MSSVCPEKYCFFWREEGGLSADGSFSNVNEALKVVTREQKSRCGCYFGICIRLDLVKGNIDWYEPNEVELAKDGLPWNHFLLFER
jgi:hypothetical protein